MTALHTLSFENVRLPTLSIHSEAFGSVKVHPIQHVRQ